MKGNRDGGFPHGAGPNIGDIIRWVEVSGESDLADAKGPVTWDAGRESASLSKDFAAFANSRDGGVIVLGKSERHDGGFSFDGLTEEQAASFDTTVVGQWVNSRFSPPVSLACHHATYAGKRFVVVIVREFDDIPVICTKGYQDPDDPKKHILKIGTLYVRSPNAASTAIQTVDQLRALIGLATRKRSDELIAHFEAMLKGRPFLGLQPVPDPFEGEVSQIRHDMKINDEAGGWRMNFRPTEYVQGLWPDNDVLEALIAKSSVRLYDEFPPHRHGTDRFGWGIGNNFYGETWALSKSGLFYFAEQFRENKEAAQWPVWRQIHPAPVDAGDGERPIPAGQWIEFKWAMRVVIGFFTFMARFVGELGAGTQVRIGVEAGPIEGRKLVTLDPNINLGDGPPRPCRAQTFAFERTLDVEELRASWEQVCAVVLKQFFELFPGHRISRDTLVKRVESFKARRF